MTFLQPVLISAFNRLPCPGLLRFREVSGLPKVSQPESGGRYDLGLSVPSLELALSTSLPAGFQPWAVLLPLGQLDIGSAGDSAELSLAGERLVLAASAHLPGAPFLPGCTKPSVCLQRTGHISSQPSEDPACTGGLHHYAN